LRFGYERDGAVDGDREPVGVAVAGFVTEPLGSPA
jgi:hypothetical protein